MTMRFTSINYPVLNTEFIRDSDDKIVDAKGYLIDLLRQRHVPCSKEVQGYAETRGLFFS